MAASSFETAGEIVARVTAEAFQTERAGMLLVDADGRIRHTAGVGVSAELSEAIARSMVGRVARDSPVWRRAEQERAPVLVDDADRAPVRPGGFVRTLQLRSYVAMPLLSATGLVGIALCGDASRSRAWSVRDGELARQLALQGGLVVDSARLRQAERARMAELAHQAFHDVLTGLPNRSLLLDRLEQAISGAAGGRERVALLLIDLDGFKQVNDTYGHHAGDVLLERVGERLLRAVRDHNTLARLGGDEFAVLITGDPDLSAVSAVAGRIHAQLEEPFGVEGRQVRIGASIGIAVFPDHAPDHSGLVRRADNAMYQAKRNGGGSRVATKA
nr:sensor domain-containing diguanylate cyclase [Planosporangium thailandense]